MKTFKSKFAFDVENNFYINALGGVETLILMGDAKGFRTFDIKGNNIIPTDSEEFKYDRVNYAVSTRHPESQKALRKLLSTNPKYARVKFSIRTPTRGYCWISIHTHIIMEKTNILSYPPIDGIYCELNIYKKHPSFNRRANLRVDTPEFPQNLLREFKYLTGLQLSF